MRAHHGDMDVVAALIPTFGMLALFAAIVVTAFRATDRGRKDDKTRPDE
jgi:hypothetical protein